MDYIWNSKTNCFVGYEPQYETKINEATGEEEQVLIPCTERLYTDDEVKAYFAECKDNKVLKDVDGVPTIVDRYTASELAKINANRRIRELKRLLASTDYIVNKLTEALAENDVEAVVSLKDEYAMELANRKLWRAEINSLEIGV